MSEPRIHRVDWSPQKISRFWDWWSEAKSEETYFSRVYGPAMIRFAEERAGVAPSDALDIGAGQGHIVRHLLDRGYRCTGLESSRASAQAINQRLRGRAGFAGVAVGSVEQMPFGDGAFDVVFLVEVIEHLLDDQLKTGLVEVQRVLRPGGVVVISTPHAEDLEANEVICPDCGAIFHRMQHLSRWTVESLARLARAYELEPLALEATHLSRSVRERLAIRGRALAERALSLDRTRTDIHLLFAGRSQARSSS